MRTSSVPAFRYVVGVVARVVVCAVLLWAGSTKAQQGFTGVGGFFGAVGGISIDANGVLAEPSETRFTNCTIYERRPWPRFLETCGN